MKIGLVGLGRMGGNMAERLRRAEIEVVGFDESASTARDVVSLAQLVEVLPSPRTIWVMVPAGDPTNATIEQLAMLLSTGDLVVDGGNSPYTDDVAHGRLLSANGIGFVDVGVSGGVWGLTEGYALMAGGSDADVKRLAPVFAGLKPTGDSGFVHAGPIGAGHFVKMVHNGIEYGMMQSFGEGYELMTASDLVVDPDAVMASWQEGSVIRSWLLDLLVRATRADPHLSETAGYAADSGEARWMVTAGVEHAVPLPVTTAALFARFASQRDDSLAMKVVAALRHQFGGHVIKHER